MERKASAWSSSVSGSPNYLLSLFVSLEEETDVCVNSLHDDDLLYVLLGDAALVTKRKCSSLCSVTARYLQALRELGLLDFVPFSQYRWWKSSLIPMFEEG